MTNEQTGVQGNREGRSSIKSATNRALQPYCRDGMPQFAEKLIVEFRAGHMSQAIALVHSYTDQSWFYDLTGCASAEPAGTTSLSTPLPPAQPLRSFGPDTPAPAPR